VLTRYPGPDFETDTSENGQYSHWPINIFIVLKIWTGLDSTKTSDTYLLSQSLFYIAKYDGSKRINGIEYVPLINQTPTLVPPYIRAEGVIDSLRLIYGKDTLAYCFSSSYVQKSDTCELYGIAERLGIYTRFFHSPRIMFQRQLIPLKDACQVDGWYTWKCFQCYDLTKDFGDTLNPIFLPFINDVVSAKTFLIKGVNRKQVYTNYFDVLGRPSARKETFKISFKAP
jgi:hypothetical protein